MRAAGYMLKAYANGYIVEWNDVLQKPESEFVRTSHTTGTCASTMPRRRHHRGNGTHAPCHGRWQVTMTVMGESCQQGRAAGNMTTLIRELDGRRERVARAAVVREGRLPVG